MLPATHEQVMATRNPSPSWVRAAKEEVRYTPDVATLYMRKNHLLFVYGEEQPGHPKSREFIGKHLCAWTGYTFNPYLVYKHRVGPLSHPVALSFDPTPHVNINRPLLHRIKGSIVVVNPARIVLLDRYRQNGVLYRRERTRILVPYYQENHDVRLMYVARVWIYLARENYWLDHLDTGFDYPILSSFKHTYRPLNPYYQFTLRDYKIFRPPLLEADHPQMLKEFIREQADKQRTLPQVS